MGLSLLWVPSHFGLSFERNKIVACHTTYSSNRQATQTLFLTTAGVSPFYFFAHRERIYSMLSVHKKGHLRITGCRFFSQLGCDGFIIVLQC